MKLKKKFFPINACIKIIPLTLFTVRKLESIHLDILVEKEKAGWKNWFSSERNSGSLVKDEKGEE
jgi:hypothetical protein